MHIAIIIPAFNVARWLGDAITSVLDQTHADWSLVVVDDGSTDETATVAAGFRDPRITLVRQSNTGVSAARNRGLTAYAPGGIKAAAAAPARKITRPDAFLFLDGDDRIALDALASLSGALDAAPWAVAACGRYARVAGSGVARLSPAPPHGHLLERLIAGNLFANGGHVLIRREAIETAGGFRQDLSYGEDWEYWTRLALLGAFVAVASRAPVLFVRERADSAYLRHATDPAAYRPVTDIIHRNPDIVRHVGAIRLADLRRRTDAETAWSIGRELIRHGEKHDGQRWLAHSVRSVPSLRRLALMGLSCLGSGPFRPYAAAARRRPMVALPYYRHCD